VADRAARFTSGVAIDRQPSLTLYPPPRQLIRINREFVAFVRTGYPRRFWGTPIGPRDAIIAAALLRLADTLESLMLLLPRRKDLDAAVLLRSMFEQMIRLCWVLISPLERIDRWEGYTAIAYPQAAPAARALRHPGVRVRR
jgi:hypothetical protein